MPLVGVISILECLLIGSRQLRRKLRGVLAGHQGSGGLGFKGVAATVMILSEPVRGIGRLKQPVATEAWTDPENVVGGPLVAPGAEEPVALCGEAERVPAYLPTGLASIDLAGPEALACVRSWSASSRS